MKVDYVNISCSESQNTARQDTLMEELQVERVFTEKMSGKDAHNRPQLQAMLDFVRYGDVVISESISRIARSTRDFLSIMDKLKAKNVTYISKKEAIDTSTSRCFYDDCVLSSFRAGAPDDPSESLRRNCRGKKRGIYKGRKPIAIDAMKFKQYILTGKPIKSQLYRRIKSSD